jgi:hypothetical protein
MLFLIIWAALFFIFVIIPCGIFVWILRRPTLRNTPIVGAFLGYFVGLYDNDFMLNPGGPNAYISQYLTDTLGIHYIYEGLSIVTFPLTGAGAYVVVKYIVTTCIRTVNSKRVARQDKENL